MKWLASLLLLLAGPAWAADANTCLQDAARYQGLPALALWGIARVEGGWPGLKRANTNGSYDLGRMQINTIHLADLGRLGISAERLANDDCTNIYVAAWLLKRAWVKTGDIWAAIGRYHSATPHLAARYRQRVWAAVAPYYGGQ